VTVTGRIASDFVPKTDDTYDLGTSALAWKDGYFDGAVKTDTISELTSAAGVTIDGLLIKDGAISASNVLGSTSGVAPAAGVIGQKIEATITTTSSITSETDITNASLTLTAGVWDIFYSCTARVVSGSTAGNNTDITIKITNSANAQIGKSARSMRCRTVAALANDVICSLSASETVAISGSTVYKLRALKTDNAGTGTVEVFNSGQLESCFYAVRIG
jgi:hypothetical protein